jgi:hypothetical protein
MKAKLYSGIFVAFVASFPSTPGFSQIIFTENCKDNVIAAEDGKFLMSCETKNLASEGELNLSAIGEVNIAVVRVAAARGILHKNELAQCTIRGEIANKKRAGIVKLQARWIDYDGKPMVTEHLIAITPFCNEK